MKRLILALLAIFLIAAPVSAQTPTSEPTPVVDSDPLSTWDEFQAEVETYSQFVTDWGTELGAVTAQDQYKLLWGDLLARSLEHLARLQMIPLEECFREYAESYVDYTLWVNQYISGVYLVTTAPEIEPPSVESADMILIVTQIYAAGTGNKLQEVTCGATPVKSPTPTV